MIDYCRKAAQATIRNKGTHLKFCKFNLMKADVIYSILFASLKEYVHISFCLEQNYTIFSQ